MKPVYEWVAFDSAISLLRPKAKWTLNHGTLEWQDPRPMPTLEEIQDTIKKIKDFEESIDYILLPEQQEEQPDLAQEDVTHGIKPYDDSDMSGGGPDGLQGKSGVPPTGWHVPQ